MGGWGESHWGQGAREAADVAEPYLGSAGGRCVLGLRSPQHLRAQCNWPCRPGTHYVFHTEPCCHRTHLCSHVNPSLQTSLRKRQQQADIPGLVAKTSNV